MGGISYAWGVFIIPLMEEYGWTKTEATLPFTVFMVVFALAMIPGGRLQDRFGPQKISRVGAFLFLISYGSTALVLASHALLGVILCYGVIGGLACGLSYACVAPPARKWFPDKPALAVSFAVMGFGLAAFGVAPIKANILIPTLGLNGTFFFLAAMTSLVSFSATFLLSNPPEGFTLTTPKSKTSTNPHGVRVPPLEISPLSMVQSTRFWLIWASFLCAVAGGFITLGLLPSYTQRVLGLDPSAGALAISIFAGVNGFGRPLAGFWADRFGTTKVMAPSFCIGAIGFFLFPYLSTSLESLLIFSAWFGWGYAVILGLYPILTAQAFGTKQLGFNYGLVFTAFGFGAIAPMIGALLYDATGSFTAIFLIAGVLSMIASCVVFVMRMKYSL